MTSQFHARITYGEIISEKTERHDKQYLICHSCGNYIDDWETYWDIDGEILCNDCAVRRYQRRNGESIY